MVEIEKKSSGARKSFGKLILIIAAALVLLAGGTAAAFFFMTGSLAENEKAESAVIAGEKLYFDMEKPFIVDYPRSASARLVQISVSFLVEGEDTVAALKKHEPMLRNNLLMLISAQNVDDLKTREGKEQLRTVMLSEAGAVLKKMAGKSRIEEVFFTSFVMQ